MGDTISNQQEQTDSQHLSLLTVFHYVVAGLAAVFACLPVIHLGLGLFMIIAPEKLGGPGQQPPVFMGWFLVVLAGCIILAGWVFAILVLITGRFLARRKRYMFCFVMACVECLFMPFGTVLGVFTLLVLMRPSVKELFTPRPTF
jgi:hypothetical protein